VGSKCQISALLIVVFGRPDGVFSRVFLGFSFLYYGLCADVFVMRYLPAHIPGFVQDCCLSLNRSFEESGRAEDIRSQCNIFSPEVRVVFPGEKKFDIFGAVSSRWDVWVARSA